MALASFSIQHPFDFIECNGTVAAVVAADGAGGFVPGPLLGEFHLHE
jgi:hypothetical protein